MNTGGPASEKTLLDEFAGQALVGFFGYITEVQTARKDPGLPGIKREQVSRECYEQAESMLAEKARREAVVQESSTTENYITDKNGIPVARVTHAPISDHSPDATKMIKLQAANRELVEALEAMVAHHTPCHWVDTSGDQYRHLNQARTALSKHKGAA